MEKIEIQKLKENLNNDELEILQELENKVSLKALIKKEDEYLHITLSNIFDLESQKYFQLLVKHKILQPFLDNSTIFILNFKELGGIDVSNLRELVQFHVQLKKQNKKLFIVGASKTIEAIFKQNGLDKTFMFRTSVRNVLVELGILKAQSFDVNFLNPFFEAVQKVMKVQCFTETTQEKFTMLKPNEFPPTDITGIIGIVSDTFNGTIMIHFKKDVYMKIVSRMLADPDFNDTKPEFMDAIGEMANMILGQAKMKLNMLGYNIQQALPSVVYGKDQTIKSLSPSPSILIPYKTEYGEFNVQITTKFN